VYCKNVTPLPLFFIQFYRLKLVVRSNLAANTFFDETLQQTVIGSRIHWNQMNFSILLCASVCFLVGNNFVFQTNSYSAVYVVDYVFEVESTPLPEIVVYVKRMVVLQSEIDGFTYVK
jgi:hypothetical protein